jgi:hypothetical protein
MSTLNSRNSGFLPLKIIHFSALNLMKLLGVREIQPLEENATAKKVYGILPEVYLYIKEDYRGLHDDWKFCKYGPIRITERLS